MEGSLKLTPKPRDIVCFLPAFLTVLTGSLSCVGMAGSLRIVKMDFDHLVKGYHSFVNGHRRPHCGDSTRLLVGARFLAMMSGPLSFPQWLFESGSIARAVAKKRRGGANLTLQLLDFIPVRKIILEGNGCFCSAWGFEASQKIGACPFAPGEDPRDLGGEVEPWLKGACPLKVEVAPHLKGPSTSKSHFCAQNELDC